MNRNGDGRTLPGDLDAERALLGAALLTPQAAATVAELGASAFFDPRHGHIAHAIAQSYTAHDGAVDATLVAGFLGDAGLLDTVGGMPTLTALMADCPAIANHARYGTRLVEVARNRRTMAAAIELAHAAEAGDNEGVARLVKALTPDLVVPGIDRFRANLHTGAQVLALPPPEPIVEGLLFTPGVSVVYGPPKAGKSFYVMALALAIVLGARIEGRATTRTRVLYISAEGRAGLSLRLDAWCAHHQLDPPDGFYVLTAAPNLRNPPDVAAIVELIHDLDVGLVIIDTLARCIVGAEESAAKDMGEVIAALDTLRDAAGHVLVVHHTGKDVKQGHRGSSAILGALDTNIELTKTEGRITVTVKDQKDALVDPPTHWRLVASNHSVVALPAAPDDPTRDDATPATWDALHALRSIAIPGGVSATAWVEAAADTGVARASLFRARAWLLTNGFIRMVGKLYEPVAPDETDDP